MQPISVDFTPHWDEFQLPTLETVCGKGTPVLELEETCQNYFKPQNKKQNSHYPCESLGHTQVITASGPFGTASHQQRAQPTIWLCVPSESTMKDNLTGP